MKAGNRLVIPCLLLLLAVPLAAEPVSHVRRFEVRYTATVGNLPAEAKQVRIWLPYPQSDSWQTVSNISVDATYPQTVKQESEYGNSILYLEGLPPAERTAAVAMTFAVERREYVNRANRRDTARSANQQDARLLGRFLKPDRLVPLDGKIAQAAQAATRGQITDQDKARAIYDYVTTHLRYDKSGTGWGRGDAVWACDAKRGNCTDYHSLLIGMARSVGIPAKFEIGLPLPDDRHEGPIGGYHCWAAFYLTGIGWVPVDSSEASKFPARREYYWGALDANRVRLSVGRDITLEPRQAGAPVNFFVYPYVEVDGEVYSDVTEQFAFQDLPEVNPPRDVEADH